MKKNILDSPRRKYTKLRWISVDTSESFSFPTSVSMTIPKSTLKIKKDLENELFEESLLTETSVSPPKKVESRMITSIVPKSSRFLKKNPSKRYYCPYYIKPAHWQNLKNAPEFNEKSENQRILNFYHHMHEEVSNPNPFIHKSESNPAVKVFNERLASLPPIQRYKQ